jgi:hypothetical protein
MKTRTKRIIMVFAIVLFAYFGAYFLSVCSAQWEHKGQVIPVPYYRPLDTEFVRALFSPAHLADAAYFRPSHWQPRSQR